MKVQRHDKEEVMSKLRDKVANGKSLFVAACGTGLVAKMLEKAGADFICTFPGARLRSNGFGTMAMFWPMLDSNGDLFEYTSRDILPVIKGDACVLSCINGNDLLRDMVVFLEKLKSIEGPKKKGKKKNPFVKKEKKRTEFKPKTEKKIVKKPVKSKAIEVTDVFENTDSKLVKKELELGGIVLGLKLPGHAGVLGTELQTGKRYGTELSNYAKHAGVKGIMHSDEDLVKVYKFSEKESSEVKKKLSTDEDDCFVLVVAPQAKAEGALEKVLERIQKFKIPVLAGILPLYNLRNAEFLNNEVPGMGVPEPIMERMRKFPTGERAREEGLTLARDALLKCKSMVQGVYVMPPFGKYDLALKVLEALN